jgi:hypothetical protein
VQLFRIRQISKRRCSLFLRAEAALPGNDLRLSKALSRSVRSGISKTKTKSGRAHPAKQEPPKQETYQFQPLEAHQLFDESKQDGMGKNLNYPKPTIDLLGALRSWIKPRTCSLPSYPPGEEEPSCTPAPFRMAITRNELISFLNWVRFPEGFPLPLGPFTQFSSEWRERAVSTE